MNKKKLLIIVILILLIIVGIILFFVFKNKVDRTYEIIKEKEYNYFLLKIDDYYGVVSRKR